MNEVANALRRLEANPSVKFEELGSNDAFIDAITTASFAAIKTSQTRKRESLRNAVLNAALPGAPDLTRQQMFLTMIERFTDRHLMLLAVFHSPRLWRENGEPLEERPSEGQTGYALLAAAFPDGLAQRELYELLWSDLYNAGLVRTLHIRNGMEGSMLDVKRTTGLGEQFLAFIHDPL